MNNYDSVYLAWQAPDSREWHVVGKLTKKDDKYIFKYTQGALSSKKFIAFSGMDDLSRVYVSNEIFPLFKNRLLSPKRPEYSKFIDWLQLPTDQVTPINILGRSGAARITDQLQMFKKIKLDNERRFEHKFFAHGIGWLNQSAQDRVNSLNSGEKLYLCIDCQNEHDDNAIVIRTKEPHEIVGFCPRYISKYLIPLLMNDSDSIEITVDKITNSAPLNYKLLCTIHGYADEKFGPDIMNGKEFTPIAKAI